MPEGAAGLAANGDPGIDLLKLDTEGAEHLVLRGFDGALARGRIAAVQFEYGRVNAVTGFLLRDLYALLEPLRALPTSRSGPTGPTWSRCSDDVPGQVAGRGVEPGGDALQWLMPPRVPIVPSIPLVGT